PLYLVDRTVNFSAEPEQIADAFAPPQQIPSREKTAALNLQQLDPLEFTASWDNAYQHLLDQAQDLLDLGALDKAEAQDIANRASQENVECCDPLPLHTAAKSSAAKSSAAESSAPSGIANRPQQNRSSFNQPLPSNSQSPLDA